MKTWLAMKTRILKPVVTIQFSRDNVFASFLVPENWTNIFSAINGGIIHYRLWIQSTKCFLFCSGRLLFNLLNLLRRTLFC